jgi:hypothetical protein
MTELPQLDKAEFLGSNPFHERKEIVLRPQAEKVKQRVKTFSEKQKVKIKSCYIEKNRSR